MAEGKRNSVLHKRLEYNFLLFFTEYVIMIEKYHKNGGQITR